MKLPKVEYMRQGKDGKVESYEPEPLKFDVFEGGESTYYLCPEKFNNGDFDYQIGAEAFKVIDEDDLFIVQLVMVKDFKSLPEDTQKSIISSSGVDEPDFYDCFAYGAYARLAEKDGKEVDEKRLIKELAKEAIQINSLLGFHLDKQANAVGATWWDFLDGHIIPKGN